MLRVRDDRGHLIYWAVVYYVARKYFKFPREWAVPLASGISICGVSAAIATGAAIKARPMVPIMVSSLVVIFAVVELLCLPLSRKTVRRISRWWPAPGWGWSVKSNGAAVAERGNYDSLICAKMHYAPGLIVGTATTVKVFIDIFIGVWSCLLAIIWRSKIEGKPGESMPLRHIGTLSQVRARLHAYLPGRVGNRLAGAQPGEKGRSAATSPAPPVAAATGPPPPSPAPAPSALEKAVACGPWSSP